MLLFYIFFQFMDALTFVMAYEQFGITGELNPVAVYLFRLGGMPLVLGTKALGVFLVSLGVITLEHRGHQEMAIGLALALGLAGAVGWGLNSLALLMG